MITKTNGLDVTVAAVIERDGEFLMVEERTSRGLLFSQPSGHMDKGETLVQAVQREVFEETAYAFEPLRLVGMYQWKCHRKGDSLRIVFSGRVTTHHPERSLDEGVVDVSWMTHAEIRSTVDRHRSPAVLQAVEDYLADRRFPLEIMSHLAAPSSLPKVMTNRYRLAMEPGWKHYQYRLARENWRLHRYG